MSRRRRASEDKPGKETEAGGLTERPPMEVDAAGRSHSRPEPGFMV